MSASAGQMLMSVMSGWTALSRRPSKYPAGAGRRLSQMSVALLFAGANAAVLAAKAASTTIPSCCQSRYLQTRVVRTCIS